MSEPMTRKAAGAARPSRKDRRVHPRLRCVIGATCRWETGAEIVGLVLDLSLIGARVAFWQAVDAPLQGELQLRTTEGNLVEVSARSVHVDRSSSRLLVGFHFDQPLTNEQLTALIG